MHGRPGRRALLEPARTRALRVEIHQNGVEAARGIHGGDPSRDRGLARAALGIEQDNPEHGTPEPTRKPTPGPDRRQGNRPPARLGLVAPILPETSAIPRLYVTRPHVVIVGAGFGGLAVARGLGGMPLDVTLIDRQ